MNSHLLLQIIDKVFWAFFNFLATSMGFWPSQHHLHHFLSVLFSLHPQADPIKLTYMYIFCVASELRLFHANLTLLWGNCNWTESARSFLNSFASSSVPNAQLCILYSFAAATPYAVRRLLVLTLMPANWADRQSADIIPYPPPGLSHPFSFFSLYLQFHHAFLPLQSSQERIAPSLPPPPRLSHLHSPFSFTISTPSLLLPR